MALAHAGPDRPGAGTPGARRPRAGLCLPRRTARRATVDYGRLGSSGADVRAKARNGAALADRRPRSRRIEAVGTPSSEGLSTRCEETAPSRQVPAYRDGRRMARAANPAPVGLPED